MKKLSLLILLVVSIGLVGCDSKPAEPTKEEKKAFQGGPMPKDFMEKNRPPSGPASPGK